MRVRNSARLVVAVLMLTTATVSMAQSDIADAAMRGDMDAVRALVDQSADVNATQGDGATAMHWAAYRGDVDLARLLTEAGADPSAANRNGSTPLWLASTNGDVAMIEALLDAGADPNEQLPLGRSPLMLAARTGNAEAVAALIEGGADINARETARGTTPLMWAADEGHAAIVALLIEEGAEITARSDPASRNARNNIGKDNDPRAAVRRQVSAILNAEVSPELGVLRAVSGLPGQLAREAAAQAEEAEANEAPLTVFDEAAPEVDDAPPAIDEAAPEAQPGDADFQGFDRNDREPDRDGGELTALVYAIRANAMDVGEHSPGGGGRCKPGHWIRLEPLAGRDSESKLSTRSVPDRERSGCKHRPRRRLDSAISGHRQSQYRRRGLPHPAARHGSSGFHQAAPGRRGRGETPG